MVFVLSEEQALSLAYVIKDDISSYVQNHQAEYEKFLVQEQQKGESKMQKTKQLVPNTRAKELSEETLNLKHAAEKSVSQFFSKFYGEKLNFKLLDIDYIGDKILVDFSSTHTSDDFFQCGRKNRNYTKKIGGQK